MIAATCLHRSGSGWSLRGPIGIDKNVDQMILLANKSLLASGSVQTSTGRARLIRSHSSARFSFELSGNLN